MSPGVGRSVVEWLWVPFAVLNLVIILKYGVAVPFSDEFETGGFIADANARGYPLLSELLAQHNESRKFVTRLLFWGLARFSGWDQRWEMVCSWLVVLATVLMLRPIVRRTLPTWAAPWVMGFVGVFVFSPTQYGNFLWGDQTALFLPQMALVGGLWVMGSRLPLAARALIGAAAALFATYSFANGMSLWVLLLPWLFLATDSSVRARVVAVVGWVCAGAAALGLYFYGYHATGPVRVLTTEQSSVWRHVELACCFVGHGLRSFGEFDGMNVEAGVLGAVVLVVWIATVVALIVRAGARRDVRGRDGSAEAGVGFGRTSRGDAALFRAALPWVTLSVYAVLAAVTAAHGRLYLEFEGMRADRYVTFVMPLLAALLPMIVLTNGGARWGWAARSYAGFALAGLCVAVGINWRNVVHTHDLRTAARALAMLYGVAPNADRGIVLLYPNSQALGPRLAELSEHGLLRFPLVTSRYADELMAGGGAELGKGSIDFIRYEGTRLFLHGWALSARGRGRQADAVVLAAVEPDGRCRLLATTVEITQARPDVARVLRGSTPEECGWSLGVDIPSIPAGTELRGFVFGVESRTLSPFGTPVRVP